MHRILLLIPTTSYRTKAFIDAARTMNVEVTVGSDHKSTLAEMNPEGFLTIDIHDIPKAVESARSFSQSYPFDAVIGVDDQSVIAASAIAEELNLHHNTIISVSAARNKYIMREFLSQRSIRQPSYVRCSLDKPPEHLINLISFPVVVKPVTLSGSRGVIRVNTPDELRDAFGRIKRLLNAVDEKELKQEDRFLLIEEYIDGHEVAVEGLLVNGECRVLAIFDKPDPLTGPYFEETIYTTPSRHNRKLQDECSAMLGEAASALKLSRGPVHAEFRFNDTGIYTIEIAARSIGGYCSKVLRFRDTAENDRPVSLEELIIRDALSDRVDMIRRETDAAGVMMIPVPGRGILRGVKGVTEARNVPHITDVLLSAPTGKELIPLPEGGKYPGFIFARADDPADVERALRNAHKKLIFDVG